VSFTDSLRAKIAARRSNGSSVRAVAEALRQQAFERIRPVPEAVVGMAERLASDPVFAAAFGVAPKPVFSWSAETPNLSTLKFDGTVGSFYVVITTIPGLPELQPKTVLQLHIWPDWSLAKMLGCGRSRYAEASPVEADIGDIAGFLVAVEDMLAEFLADVFVCDAAGKFLPGVEDTGP